VTPVARLADIPDPGVLGVKLPSGERVCLVRRGSQVSAFHDECPHSGMPLSEGEVVGSCELECSWHGARFDCATGAVRQGPADEPLVRYGVRIEGEDVLVGERVVDG
jgi:nitrite reductase/ring-hydroxylating ferredoxin subunit